MSQPSAAASARAAQFNERGAKRPALRILAPRPRRGGRLLRMLAAGVVAGALLAVVVGHSMLAEGQVSLTAEQRQMAAEQAVHRQLLATVAQAEDPATIVAEAKQLNLVPPATITQLPAVPLNAPIAGISTTTTSPASSGSASSSKTASTSSATGGT